MKISIIRTSRPSTKNKAVKRKEKNELPPTPLPWYRLRYILSEKIYERDHETVRQLLTDYKRSPYTHAKDGWSPLIIAIKLDDRRMVDILRDFIEGTDGWDQPAWTPPSGFPKTEGPVDEKTLKDHLVDHLASRLHEEMHQKRLDPHLLHKAVQNSDYLLIEALEKKELGHWGQDPQGKTPWDYATSGKSTLKTVSALARYGHTMDV